MTTCTAWTLVGVAMVVGTVLRFTHLNATSLRGDEIVSLTIATGNPIYGEWEPGSTHKTDYYRPFISLDANYFSQRLVSVLRNDVHPPLYFFLLNLWLHLFGTSEVALRSFSVLASVCCIPLMYALGRRIASIEVGVYSALIFSIVPFQLAYAQEARSYALSLCLALLATLSVVRLCQEAKAWRWLLAYAFTAFLGLYTHYFFFWNILFHWLVVIFSQRRDRQGLIRWGVVQALVMGSFLLWLPTFAEQVHWSNESGVRSAYFGTLSLSDVMLSAGRNLALFLSVGRVQGFCSFLIDGAHCRLDTLFTWLFHGVALVVVSASVWRIFWHLSATSSALRQVFGMCILWSACIFGGTISLDILLHSGAVKTPRYLFFASVPLYLAVAACLASVTHERLRRGLISALLVLLLAGSGLYLQGLARTVKYEQGFREAARRLERSATSDDLVSNSRNSLKPCILGAVSFVFS